jgi:CHAD domain-containing protein
MQAIFSGTCSPAADIFARRTKTITKKAKKIRELDSQQRHKLRIAVKKLRYASDFFGHLFASRRAKQRLPSFKARLTDLQDCLGALNDIKVHQKLAPKPAAGKVARKSGPRASLCHRCRVRP